MTGQGIDDASLGPLVGTVQDPWAYIAVISIGLLVYGIRALVSGTLRTGREADVLQKRAETAEAAMRIRDEQIDRALRVLPQVAEVLEKFHVAGEQVRQERGDSTPGGDPS